MGHVVTPRILVPIWPTYTIYRVYFQLLHASQDRHYIWPKYAMLLSGIYSQGTNMGVVYTSSPNSNMAYIGKEILGVTILIGPG